MKRPWNIVDHAVYSLVSYDNANKINMNICTYVSAISMKPKVFMIAIYYGTKTYDNLLNSKSFVLQVLSKKNIGLVRTLGKKSGLKIDKEKYLKKKKLVSWKDFEILPEICATIELKKHSVIKNHADHAICLFDVASFKTFSEKNILTTKDLKDKKIIL
tara:strand:- start:733 stop:1209 length:477 start_codon:yes stop_codon:yes gene_type:complete